MKNDEKLINRRRVINALYLERHNGVPPTELYEKYLVETLIKLRDVYEDNFIQIHRLVNKGDRNNIYLQHIQREDVLNRISNIIRRGLSISLVVGEVKKEAPHISRYGKIYGK